MPRILLIEDDVELAGRLSKLLDDEGYTPDVSHNGSVGLAMLQQYKYDLVIVDWNLPEKSGIEIIEEFRRAGGQIPMLLLTGEAGVTQKIIGFDAGVDDYLTKPFNAQELIARLGALLRRPPSYSENILEFADLVLDVDNTRVTLGGQELSLQRLEFRLLEFLLRNKGRTFTAEAILERVWPADSEASIETVRGYIKTLRKKLAAAGERPTIRNIYGLGYKLE